MTSFHIKLIAIIAMVIDHVSLFFYPDNLALKIVGRLSFPLFAFMVAIGARHTQNISKYFLRMLIFALISQTPYHLTHRLINPEFSKLNVLFTFSLALLAIILSTKITKVLVKLIPIVLSAAAAQFLKTDYGALGLLLVISFYYFFDNFKISSFSQVIFAFLATLISVSGFKQFSISQIDLGPAISLLTIPIIYSYNYKEGPKAKYLFYIFYPLQYTIIYLTMTIFSR
ncbi:MAG: TraX family protein [Candidatus Shapirobacteria bacterium]|jgi:hypothetical protein